MRSVKLNFPLVIVGLYAIALSYTGCKPTPQECASGTGTLGFKNTSLEAATIAWSNSDGDLDPIRVEAGATQDLLEPADTYQIVAIGEVTHSVLFQDSVQNKCDGQNEVLITPKPLELKVTVNGSGLVTSTPEAIRCGGTEQTCTAQRPPLSQITLTATPSSVDTVFAGWGGACSGKNPCIVTMNQAQEVTATFAQATYFRLTRTTVCNVDSCGTGTAPMGYFPDGTLTARGESCSGSAPKTICTSDFPIGTQLSVSAAGSIQGFFGQTPVSGTWSEDCTGTTGDACALTMDRPHSVTATFNK